MMMSLAADNGPTEAAWKAMVAKPDKYVSLIRRLTGFYLMAAAAEGDNDFPSIGRTVDAYIPEYIDLTEDEAYFVQIGAVNIICQYQPAETIDLMVQDWIADGAPE